MRKLMGIMVLAMVLVMAGQAMAQDSETVTGTVTVSPGELTLSISPALTTGFGTIDMTQWFTDPTEYNTMESNQDLDFEITNTRGKDTGWSLKIEASEFTNGTDNLIIDKLTLAKPILTDITDVTTHGQWNFDEWNPQGGDLLTGDTPGSLTLFSVSKNNGRGIFNYRMDMTYLVLDAYAGVAPPDEGTFTSTWTVTLSEDPTP